MQRSNTTGSTTTTESYLYTYVSSGVNTGLIANVTLRRQINGGSWSTVRQVVYTYYDGSQAHGNAGDLEMANVEDGSGNILDTEYYRYYTGESGGYVHGLKYYFDTAAYARLAAAFGSPTTATDAQVAPYADNYFQYNSFQQVTEEMVQGDGSSLNGTGGLGTYTFQYFALSLNTFGFNSWTYKTLETLPDGSTHTLYANYAGEVMLDVFHDPVSGNNWETFTEYDSSGRAILTAQPSALTGYSESSPTLLNGTFGSYEFMTGSSGLLNITDYYTSTTATATTAGGVAGYVEDTKIQEGQAGTAILQETTQYFTRAAGGDTVDPIATDTVYRNTDGTGGETTSYTYTWFTGTTMMQSQAVSKPVVTSAENGPGTADVTTTYYDIYGRPIWTMDADGFISYTAYDQASGAEITSITDVNTADTSEFQNLPSGWSTPTGGGLNLITQMQVDSLGRTTMETDPNGNVTYTVYLDPAHEVRVYPGWQSSTDTTTGPTQVTREDLANSYTETFTMSATPHVTGGVPDGTEAISNLQTLSRDYTNSGGQLVRTDDYFYLSGVSYATTPYIGTQNTNYYTNLTDYDARGRETRVQAPTGTITRTVYDSLGRVISTWVGTNDSPTAAWSPSNNAFPANMVDVEDKVYDGGVGYVGDSNLTQVTDNPGGSAAGA